MNADARANWQPTPFRILAASVAAGTVVAANVLMLAAQPVDADADAAMPARPAAITGIAAPSVRAGLDLDDIEFVVPVLDRPDIRMPDLPDIERSLVLGRRAASARPLPIDAAAPPVTVDAFEEELEVPSLQRPDLPAPPPVR